MISASSTPKTCTFVCEKSAAGPEASTILGSETAVLAIGAVLGATLGTEIISILSSAYI